MGYTSGALRALHRALSDRKFRNIGDGWYNLGILHEDRAEPNAAREALRRAAALFASTGESAKADIAQRDREKIKPRKGGRSSLETPLPPLPRPASLQPRAGVEEEARAKRGHSLQSSTETPYHRCDHDRPRFNEDNVLLILKGWGSTAPLLQEDEGARGGGYFLRWKGKGIVVDPGIHFLQNFRRLGLHPRQVNAVLVSHNHTDHNADLRSLDDLLYEMRGCSKEGSAYRYVLFWDSDTRKARLLDPSQWRIRAHRRGVAHHLRPPVELNRRALRDNGLPFPLDLRQRSLGSISAKLEFFRVEHSLEGGGLTFPVGFRFTFLEPKLRGEVLKVGFTNDTQYFRRLSHKRCIFRHE